MAKLKKNYLKFKDGFNVGHLATTIAEEDSNLPMYYVSNETYVRRALDREDKVSVFVGPKGVGKSAILEMVRCDQRANGNEARLIEIKPDDLAFNTLVNLERKTPLLTVASKNKFLFTALWNFVLCTEVLKYESTPTNSVSVVLQKMFGERHKKEQSELLKLATKGGSSTMTDKMLSLINAVQIEVEAAGVTGSAKIEAREPKEAHGGDLKLLQLVNSVAKALPQNIGREYFILIDDLDLHWTGSELQNAFLGSLFFSIRKLSADRRIKFVVSLRRNIYREIHLEERDKFADFVETVEWSRDVVKRMVQRRITFLLNNVAESQIWGGLFDESDAFDKLWRHTDGMPREVIRLVAHCIRAATTDGAVSVTDEHLTRGLLSFSEDRLDDLANLFQFEYPELSVLFRQFKGGRKEFDIEAIMEACFRVAELPLPAERTPAVSWITNGVDDPLSVSRVLLRIGFLLLKDGRSAPPRSATEEDILMMDNTRWFAIHTMYHFGLGLDGT